jgi:hypothetical protein
MTGWTSVQSSGSGTALKKIMSFMHLKHLMKRTMKLKKLIKKINKENTPPGGWRSRDKVSSSQAGGPAHKESGFKQLRLTSDKLIRYYRTHR